MALEAGVMSITLEFAKDLKDGDWFGKQDPYCVIRVGGQTFRTRTAIDGGRNPVWNQTFDFNVINENSVEIDVKDEDVGKDDLLGTATFSLARAREAGSDRINVPVLSKKSRKQHGFIAVSLKWVPNRSLRPAAAAPPPQYAATPYAAAPYAPMQPGPYGMAPPQPAHAAYGAPGMPQQLYPPASYAPAAPPAFMVYPPPYAAGGCAHAGYPTAPVLHR